CRYLPETGPDDRRAASSRYKIPSPGRDRASGFPGSDGNPSRRLPIRRRPVCVWGGKKKWVPLDHQLGAIPIGVLAMAVEEDAKLVDAVDDLVLVQNVPARLHLADGAEDFV